MGFLAFDVGSSKGDDYAKKAAKQEQERQDRIKTGMSSINDAFAGYDDNFYNQRAQAYQNFALPELSQQYQQNRNQLVFNLANRGLLRSSAADKQWNTLGRTMAQGRQGIVDAGIAQSQQLRRDVENQKDSLIGNLYQSADPAQAAEAATRTAASFAAPSTFAPLGNAFGNIAQQYYLSQLINKNQPNTFVQAPSYSTPAANPAVQSVY